MSIRGAAVWVVAWIALGMATHASQAQAADYTAPKRSVAQIAHAIGSSHPKLTAAKRTKLARLLIDVSKKHNFDALSGWAIIDHESDWRADAVSADGHDIGLAQIRYTVSEACRDDRDADACKARREALLDPATNIRAMASAITAWRELCTKVTGRAPDMKNWLAGYGGYSRPKQNIFCGRKRVRTKRGFWWKDLPTPKPIADILASRKAMIVTLKKQRVG